MPYKSNLFLMIDEDPAYLGMLKLGFSEGIHKFGLAHIESCCPKSGELHACLHVFCPMIVLVQMVVGFVYIGKLFFFILRCTQLMGTGIAIIYQRCTNLKATVQEEGAVYNL